ncbi:MAG: FAD-dependent oxidoreductase [Burkholderiaceae bacterium]|nr:FAD-dependent oxidoreductase [Burkholderiaceae bacterium]
MNDTRPPALPALPAWLDAGAAPPAATLDAALPGLARAQSMSPLQRLQHVQRSGLAECGAAGDPVHLAWRRFLRGHGPSTLVIDATTYDERSLGAAAVLERAPFLLAEGVAIALGLRDSMAIELRLPAALTGHERSLLNAVDTIRTMANIKAGQRRIDIQRQCEPSCWAEAPAGDASRLVHTPETWCRIARLFAGAAGLDAALLTLRSGLRQRGLVEFDRAGHLRDLIDDWGGGVEVQGEDPVLAFDDGLGGFLPQSRADLACEPLSFAAAGIAPSPATLMVMAAGTCVVKQTRRALYRHWRLAEGERPEVRGLLARVARLTTEITLGRGDAGHLAALDELALNLATQGLAAAWPLGSSLRHFRTQWEQHVRRESCAEGVCLDLPHHAAPCHGTCPANIDIPSFMAHLGHGDYRATIEVIRRDNPLPLTCGLVCPAPCESACVRSSYDGAVFIRPLKAVAAEHCLANGGYPRPEIAPDTGKRIGIVGSGPAGLTAAYYLRTHGHQVEIFEAQEHAGGMLRYGIPAYRLPPELLEQELEQIKVLGIPIHTGARIERLEDFRKAYDAVFVGPGTQTARLLPIDGAHHPFVLGGIDFLRAVRSGETVRVGPRVVVVGGGNVAIDVALTALRQGAKSVDLVSLEKRREMPASPHEIDGRLPVLRAREGRERQIRPEVRRRAAADARRGPRHPRHRPGHRSGAARRQRRRGRARLYQRRPEDADDQRAGRLRRRRRAARAAHCGRGDPRRQDRRRVDRRLAARHAEGRDDGPAGAPRRGDPDRRRSEATHAPAPRRDAREGRGGGAGPGQLRAHRRRPERRRRAS